MPDDTGTSPPLRGLIPRRQPASIRRRPSAADALRRLRSDPRPPRLALALGALGLVGIVLGCLIAVAVAARGPGPLSPPSHSHYFPAWLAGPLGDTWPFPSTGSTLLHVFDYAVAGMYPFYGLAILFAARLRRRWTLAAILAVHVIFLLSPPLALTDVFNYINYGRMEIVHGLNPYATIPALEPHGDPAYALSNWHHLMSPYGPLFTLFTFTLVPLGVVASFWVFKATLMLASLAILGLVWRCAELLHRDPLKAAILVGLNPPVLVWGLGGAHNDFLMVVFMMLAVYLLLSSRRRPFSSALLVDGASIGGRRLIRRPARPACVLLGRPVAALRAAAGRAASGLVAAVRPAPAWVGAPADGAGRDLAIAAPAIPARRPLPPAPPGVAAWPPRRVAAAATREKALQFLAGVALVMACAIKLPAAILAPILFVAAPRRRYLLAGMALALLGIGLASYAAFGAHLPDLGVQSNLVTTVGLPNLLGVSLGLGGESPGLRTAVTGLLLAIVGLCAVWSHRRHGDWLVPGAVAVLALVLTLSWQAPWYVLWLLPLAALARRPHLRVAAVVLGVYLIFAYTSLINLRPPSTPLQQEQWHETKYLVH